MAANTNESANSSLSLAQALSQGNAPAAQNAGSQASPRTDAIGIEIAVVVYASRYSAAGRGVSKAPPPVREETRTVIVFPQGAVVRLSATLAVGEMVVLTNQQTGADVLCRVGAVKAQPGVQNYVDLEFTQRAPGFWDGDSGAGPSARMESTAFEPATRTAATFPNNSATKEHLGSPSWLSTEPVSPVASATPVSRPAAATAPNTPFAFDSPRSSSASSAVPHASNILSGMSAGLRLAQPDPLTLSGRQSDWAKQGPARSKKGLWAAAAIVAVASVVAGGFLLSHRGRSAPSDAAVTVAAPSVPSQPATPSTSDGPQASANAEPAPSTSPAPVNAPTWVPDTPQHEQAQREQPHEQVPAEQTRSAAVTQPAPTRDPAPSGRSAIPVANLATPIARTPAMASSSEPPPVLVTQDNATAEGALRSGVLSGASGIEAPTAFPGVTIPPVRSVGGRIQMPKLISSPDPLYPTTARAQSAEGIVSMDALVDATGKVTEVKVLSGPVPLRQAAIDAVRKWKYQPARLDGQPTSIHTQVNISFKLR